MEDFAISVVSNELQAVEDGSIPGRLEAYLRADFKELAEEPVQLHLERGISGYGYSAATIILTVINTAGAAATIGQGITALVKYARGLQSGLGKLKKNEDVIRVAMSEPAARSIAINTLVEQGVAEDGLTVVASHVLPVANGSLPENALRDFSRQPDRYYLFILRAGNEDTFVVCMRSSGQVEFFQRLATGAWMEYVGGLPH
jgi:hypothetical protein